MQRDGAEGDDAGVFEAHPLGQRNRQVAGDTDDLGVMRELRAGACHAVAGSDIRDALPDFLHDASRGVSRRAACRELARDEVPGPWNANRRDRLEDSLDLLRLGERTLPQRRTAARETAELGAARYA